VVTLEYHDVVERGAFDSSGFTDVGSNSYKLAVEDFEAHLRALAGTPGIGRDVRTLVEDDASRPAVLLTFDDGGVSSRTVIAGLLEAHGMVGHFFVTTGRVGTPAFLACADIRELVARGHVVGSHSHSHPMRMARLTAAQLRAEWTESARRLEDCTGQPVAVASVPGGYYARGVALAAAEAGIRWLFTSEPITRVWTVGECRVLGRYTLRRGASARTALGLVRRISPWRTGQWVSWSAKRALKAVAGDTYLRIRASMLGDRSDAGSPEKR
jgi:peptidoglycan/xylan/chitin deacetylase (PgdA/CDA1 family)